MGIGAGTVSSDTAYYSTFSGSDMTVVIGTKIVGTLQAISYSAQREKGPLYVMKGDPNPVGFARGKRAVAGTLVFLTLDRTSLLGHMEANHSSIAAGAAGLQLDEFWKSKHEVKYNVNSTNNTYGGDATIGDIGESFESLFNSTVANTGDLRDKASAFYADQLLPFDVFIAGSNEYGKTIKKAVIGCEILNEGSGVSVDDLVLEEQYSYIARAITPWTKSADITA